MLVSKFKDVSYKVRSHVLNNTVNITFTQVEISLKDSFVILLTIGGAGPYA